MSQTEFKKLKNTEIGIGIIGVGGIAQNAHLPAYKKANLKVVAAADPSPEARERAQKQWGIPKVFADYKEMLKLPEVKVVDITTQPVIKLPHMMDTINAGKHLLVQKPFYREFKGAKQVVEAAEKAGVVLAINQNARWIPELIPVKGLIADGYIGEPYFAFFMERAFGDMPAGTWKAELDPFIIFQNSVHYLDLIRYWFGEPKLLYAITAKDKTQNAKGEQVAVISLEYNNNFKVCFVNDWRYRGGNSNSEICIEGTKGSIVGFKEDRILTLRSSEVPGDGIKTYTAEGKWFPDAFIGPMVDLLDSVRENRQPLANGRDNLKTLQVILAAYKSVTEKRAVSPEEIK